MNWLQKLCNKLFGWQYVMYAVHEKRAEVRRVHRIEAALFIHKISSHGDQYFLTKETMAPSSAHLSANLASYSLGKMRMKQPWDWAALTNNLEGFVCMMPELDDASAPDAVKTSKPCPSKQRYAMKPGQVHRVKAPPPPPATALPPSHAEMERMVRMMQECGIDPNPYIQRMINPAVVHKLDEALERGQAGFEELIR